MPDQHSRRDLFRKAGAAVAPALLSAQNPNSELQLGWIGVGSRGYYLMDMLYKGGPNPSK